MKVQQSKKHIYIFLFFVSSSENIQKAVIEY